MIKVYINKLHHDMLLDHYLKINYYKMVLSLIIYRPRSIKLTLIFPHK